MILDRFKSTKYKFEFDLQFLHRILMIDGDSGVGKSLFYKMMYSKALNNKDIICINRGSSWIDLSKELRKHSNKLIIVDNAEVILGDRERFIISTDITNQYIIFGRNPEGLVRCPIQYARMKIKDNRVVLDYPLLIKKIDEWGA